MRCQLCLISILIQNGAFGFKNVPQGFPDYPRRKFLKKPVLKFGNGETFVEDSINKEEFYLKRTIMQK